MPLTPRTPTGTLLLNVWQEHNHYVHGREDPALAAQFAQIEQEAAAQAQADIARLREALERLVKAARSRPGYILTEMDVRAAEDALEPASGDTAIPSDDSEGEAG